MRAVGWGWGWAGAALGLGALLLLGVGSAGIALLRDPVPHIRERHSSIEWVRLSEPFLEDGYELTQVHLRAASGLAVDLLIRRALGDTGRLPAAVILGGYETGARSARLLGETKGVVVAALAYPLAGGVPRGAMEFLQGIPRIRRAFLDTPPALLLALDYLWARHDVDTTQVEAIGVSLGAPFVCIAGALDDRFSRIWAIHGSGGSYVPLEANMRRTISFAPFRYLAASLATVIISGPQLDPVRWVPHIAPREFVMVSATDDERMPRSAVNALYTSAREPKEHIWMSGNHVHRDSATVERLVGIVMARMN